MIKSELRAQIAFRLAGLKTDDALDAGRLRPALCARYNDLASLRYDFPVVLPANPAGGEYAVPLSTVLDRLMEQTPGDEREKQPVRNAVLKLEREIRVALAHGASGTLRELWDLAASRICVSGNERVAGHLARALGMLKMEGAVVDCDARFPSAFVMQAWQAVQNEKAKRFRADLDRLILSLGQILAADDARSQQSRSSKRLREAVGSLHRDAFDFEQLSRILGRAGDWRPLTDSRRQRVRALLASLEAQRFFMAGSGYTFAFNRCGTALRTFRARYPRLRALARSMAMARLEIEGLYVEAQHDTLFGRIKEAPVARDELARFPDYLVCLTEGALDAGGREELIELLVSGIPAKILLQTDDLLDQACAAEALSGVAARADAATGIALGLNDVFVVQASASHLPRMCEEVRRAIASPGPALISVFSGAVSDSSTLPAYLNAAAAMESRVFPAFTYDPSKGLDRASRFSLEGNPQPDRDWPVHTLDYEDANHQGVRREVSFTLADFVAADQRFAAHFLPVSSTASGRFVPISAWIDGDGVEDDEASPSLALVDQGDRLREVVVDESVIDLARRCRDRWRRLQKWSSVAAPSIALEPAAAPAAAAAPVPASPAAIASPPPAAAAVVADSAATPAPATAPGEAYIETPRCTTCDECTRLNNRMFAYDGNKQAYIADITAGTYRQLVEAAENCQVSIIHPGKPRDPQEPGVEELLERAAAFN